MMWRWGIVIATIGIQGAFGCQESETPVSDSVVLEGRAIEEREKLRSASLLIEQATSYQLKDQIFRQQRTLRCRVDGDRIWYEGLTGDKLWVSCTGCMQRDVHLAFFDSAMQGGGNPLIVLNSAGNIPQMMQLPHPRLIGMMPLPLDVTGRRGIDAYLTRVDRTDVSLLDENLGVDACKKVTFSTANHSQVDIWICCDKGYSVLQIDETYEAGAGQIAVDSARSTVSFDSKSELWFPTEVAFSKLIDGVEVGRETLYLQVLSLNSPIENNLFTMSQLPGLVPGTIVRDMTSDDRAESYWDGTALTSELPISLMPNVETTAPYWRHGIGLILVLIGVPLLYRGFRNK